MNLAAYTKPQADRRTAEALADLGIEAHAPIALEPGKSRGKSRAPEMHERVLIPRVVFLSCSDADYHRAMATRAARDVLACLRIPDRTWQRRVMPWIEEAALELDHVRARLAAGEAVQHYRAGESLRLVGGSFDGQLARFVETVERDGDLLMRVRLQVLGAERPVLVDPLGARRE